jgi:hypothetical protein
LAVEDLALRLKLRRAIAAIRALAATARPAILGSTSRQGQQRREE